MAHEGSLAPTASPLARRALQLASSHSKTRVRNLYVRDLHGRIKAKEIAIEAKANKVVQVLKTRTANHLPLAVSSRLTHPAALMGMQQPPDALENLISSRGGCAVIDGGLATELERKGADIVDPLWSAKYLIEDPDLIRQVHMDYLRAGADMVLSASYQASIPGFAARGISAEQGAELLRMSVRIAKQARDDFWAEVEGQDAVDAAKPGEATKRPLVGASVGPYAAYLADGSEYTGSYGPNIGVPELMEFHRGRLRLFAMESPDFLAFETIPCKLEAEAIVKVLEEEKLGIPAWISFNSNDGVTVPSGDPYAECVALAEGCSEIVAVGVNCTAPRYILSLLTIAGKVTKKPLVAYPNCGEQYDGEKKQWIPSTGACDEDFVAYTPVWRDVGAKLIGGCCRTTPHTIKCILSALKIENHGHHQGGEMAGICV